MPTSTQRKRDAVIAEHGRHCMYCGSGPLRTRALHIDTVLQVPMCHTCFTRRGDTSFKKYVEKRIAELKAERDALAILCQSYAVIEARAEE